MMNLNLLSNDQLARILFNSGRTIPALKAEKILAVNGLGLSDSDLVRLANQSPNLEYEPVPEPVPVQPTNIDMDDLFKRLQSEIGLQFNAFRAVSSTEVLHKVAANLPPRHASAGELFGQDVCRYSGVDFSSLLVAVWDDPAAPQVVPDYVFDPENLHQALVAMDDPLPDNVWLAGERGTGKTEFVSQIAARTGRKLFRVNFDEAIERADFIGGNTIENGTVVWKPGIITQAIQHPGAIVMLDEVGFARAQSIAVLHSLCERSPHRAVTVNETGEKIKVLDHVVFFAADNSNGYGNTSGNFSGIREQNSAFLDRFGFTLRFNFLPFHQEVDLVAKRSGASKQVANNVCKIAEIARQKASAGLLTQPPSLRQLIAWARAAAKGVPFKRAYENAVINKFPADCEPELLAAFITINGEESYDSGF